MGRKINPRAAFGAAIGAGLVFILLEMAMVRLFQDESPWAPPRMIAAIGMGEGVLPPPATFDAGIVAVAMVIHFALSVVIAFILASGIARFALGATASVAGGALFGLLVYLVDFHGFTAVFPWFAMARGPISIFAHIVFGMVLGGTYWFLDSRSIGRMTRPGERAT
jgi:hypothetical protein